MELRPREHETQLLARKVAIDHLEVVDPDLRLPSAWRAWKCGYPWSSKNIAIVIPKKRLIVGTSRSWGSHRIRTFLAPSACESALPSGVLESSDDPKDVTQDIATGSKARRQADFALVGSYYEAQLAELLERVREGFARYDAKELNAFDLDDVIHRYKRATRELWKFCGDATGSRAGVDRAHARGDGGPGEVVDWRERGNPPRHG